MDNGIIVTAGLVLRETETKESDKILTVLTPELGRISVIAKGARSRRSKYTAACQLLAYDEMTLRRKGEWYYLAEAGTLELFDGVRQDIQRLALASYFAELTETVCQDALAAAEILPLLLNALFALLGKWSFEIFLVHLLLFGYMNELGVEMRGNLAWLAAIAVSVVFSIGYGKLIEHLRKRKQ